MDAIGILDKLRDGQAISGDELNVVYVALTEVDMLEKSEAILLGQKKELIDENTRLTAELADAQELQSHAEFSMENLKADLANKPALDAEVREFKFTSYKAAREWLDFPLGNHDTAYWLNQHIEPIKHALDMAIIRAASAVQEVTENEFYYTINTKMEQRVSMNTMEKTFAETSSVTQLNCLMKKIMSFCKH